MVNKGPFMEFVKASILESAANTFTAQEIPMPVSRTENLAMLIHKVTMEIDTALSLSDADGFDLGWFDKEPAAMTNVDDANLIGGSKFSTRADIETSGGNVLVLQRDIVFDPPILYAKTKSWLGILGNSQGAALTGAIVVGYTLEKVDKDAFIAALVED